MAVKNWWTALWDVDDPGYPHFDYTAKKYYLCGLAHYKRLSVIAMILSVLELIGLVFIIVTQFAPGPILAYEYVLFPLLAIVTILLWWGLRDHHAFRLIPYIFVQMIQAVFHLVPALILLFMLVSSKQGEDKNHDGIDDPNFWTKIYEMGWPLAVILAVTSLFYLLIVYVVYKCREYFLHIDEAQSKTLPNIRYQNKH